MDFSIKFDISDPSLTNSLDVLQEITMMLFDADFEFKNDLTRFEKYKLARELARDFPEKLHYDGYPAKDDKTGIVVNDFDMCLKQYINTVVHNYINTNPVLNKIVSLKLQIESIKSFEYVIDNYTFDKFALINYFHLSDDVLTRFSDPTFMILDQLKNALDKFVEDLVNEFDPDLLISFELDTEALLNIKIRFERESQLTLEFIKQKLEPYINFNLVN